MECSLFPRFPVFWTHFSHASRKRAPRASLQMAAPARPSYEDMLRAHAAFAAAIASGTRALCDATPLEGGRLPYGESAPYTVRLLVDWDPPSSAPTSTLLFNVVDGDGHGLAHFKATATRTGKMSVTLAYPPFNADHSEYIEPAFTVCAPARAAVCPHVPRAPLCAPAPRVPLCAPTCPRAPLCAPTCPHVPPRAAVCPARAPPRAPPPPVPPSPHSLHCQTTPNPRTPTRSNLPQAGPRTMSP